MKLMFEDCSSCESRKAFKKELWPAYSIQEPGECLRIKKDGKDCVALRQDVQRQRKIDKGECPDCEYCCEDDGGYLCPEHEQEEECVTENSF